MIERSTSLREARRARSIRQVKNVNPLDPHGEPEGEIYDPKDFVGVNASLVILVKACGDYLEKTYPGWAWGLTADQNGGVINVFSGRLNPSYGLVIHIEDLQNDPELRVLKRLAGQMLERFGMPRGSFEHALPEYRAAHRNPMGELIPDLSDKPANKLMMRELIEQGRFNPQFKQQHQGSAM